MPIVFEFEKRTTGNKGAQEVIESAWLVGEVAVLARPLIKIIASRTTMADVQPILAGREIYRVINVEDPNSPDQSTLYRKYKNGTKRVVSEVKFKIKIDEENRGLSSKFVTWHVFGEPPREKKKRKPRQPRKMNSSDSTVWDRRER